DCNQVDSTGPDQHNVRGEADPCPDDSYDCQAGCGNIRQYHQVDSTGSDQHNVRREADPCPDDSIDCQAGCGNIRQYHQVDSTGPSQHDNRHKNDSCRWHDFDNIWHKADTGTDEHFGSEAVEACRWAESCRPDAAEKGRTQTEGDSEAHNSRQV
ncbi:MAG: hypothetical protein ACK5AN_26395, partial [Planctomyces sp.]